MVPLKLAIEENHRKAEQREFSQRMFRGELSVYEYRLYLYQLIRIFAMIEKYPLPNPDLNRLAKAQGDLNELVDPRPLVWTRSITEYTSYLDTLTQEQLLPHVYINYMALLFGGQMIKDKVPGSGKMYIFNDTKSAARSIRELQQDSWAEEANLALFYHIRMFDELQRLFRYNSK